MDRATIERHGLTPEEYDRIVVHLGREPNLTELGLFSVMWSEHCSYKSSRLHLRRLPTRGPRVVEGPGENAGAVEIGDGLVAVFKIESHNHPSFVEPFQGAATGVGGIIRDIFTMGARPIALLNSLRFGPLELPLNRRVMEGVVAGISAYGNSVGIATIGGEVAFEDCYTTNPLVNVLCLGLARAGRLVRGRASGVGNAVYYVGAKTGRDGIHGATMASAEFDQRAADKRPAVQVGDPFMEKLLLEACLEALETGAVVGLQDMGAAGLTCSTAEMAARAGTGIELDVALVPQRETDMTPYEIMLSESQERMLLVVERGRERDIEQIFAKWDLDAVRIGEVTGDGQLRVKANGVVVAEVPTRALVDEAPVYARPTREPAYLAAAWRLTPGQLGPVPPAGEVLLRLLGSPTIASKRWVYRQYDHMIGTASLVRDGLGAGVVRVKGTRRALAISVDGNGRYCYLDPRRGAMLAVAEAARNVACAGAVPVGLTNCLNFGNPERPEIMWQFVRAVDGLAEAARALGIPVTGGNVSFYNETDGRAIFPTPVVGVVGVIDEATAALSRLLRHEGDRLVLLGWPDPTLGASEYLKVIAGRIEGRPPGIDLAQEAALNRLLADAAAAGWLESAHDCAEGGLAVTLAECTFDTGGLGIEVDLPLLSQPGWEELSVVLTLFGETAATAVVSVAERHLSALLVRAAEARVPARVIGRVGGSRLRMAVAGELVVDIAVGEAEAVWAEALARSMARRAA
jgi:phosphoribosylformylglycinamidine synthase II